MANLFTFPKVRALDNDVLVVPGALLYFYETGTSNPQNTYSDVFLTTPHTNPVIADFFGTFPPIWLDTRTSLYRVRLANAQDVELWVVDDVGGAAAIPIDAQILTINSIRGGGDLSVDRTFDLVGDVEFPGANKVYGTDSNGDRLWKDDPSGGTTTDVQIFTASGTWTQPVGELGGPIAKLVEVICIGGGGGGGSGRKGIEGNNRLGGSGGGGGGLSSHVFIGGVQIGDTEIVTVGLGGSGGSAQATNSTNGNNGTAGGNSSFGNLLKAIGGARGLAGTTTGTISGGAAGSGLTSDGGAGANVLNTAGVQPAGSVSRYGGSGGGCGGRIDTYPTISFGSAGGAQPTIYNGTLAGGTGGTVAGQDAGNGTSPVNQCIPGSGGGGGSPNTYNLNGGTGGIGGRGAGGGGGGPTGNGSGSGGAGGNGGDGIVVVISYF